MRRADFVGARFAGSVKFLETKFKPKPAGADHEPDADREPCPVFGSATFEKPEHVKFYGTDLRRALFHDCDVSRVEFSNVDWRKRRNGKRMVFDEEVDLSDNAAEALRLYEGEREERNYRVIAELYQRLKKNYDDRCDYWTAGDFHYGEMEMKRLSSPLKSKALRWVHRNLGLVAWYRYASEYGESYVRPGLWLIPVLLGFALLYSAAGLLFDSGRGAPATIASQGVTLPDGSSRAGMSPCAGQLSYWCPWPGGADPHVWRARGRPFGNSVMTSLYVAAFQKDLTYQPSYPWGRLLALIEVVLTSTLGALFLLAVRRQFKR